MSQDKENRTNDKPVKLYAVIRFLNIDENNEETIATVPKCWICVERDTLVCKWPPRQTNIQILMKKLVCPSIDWKNFPCQVLKEFENLLSAKKYEKKIVEMESTESETDSSKHVGKGCRKKKKKQSTDFDDSDISSDSEQNWETIKTVLGSQTPKSNELSLPADDSSDKSTNIQSSTLNAVEANDNDRTLISNNSDVLIYETLYTPSENNYLESSQSPGCQACVEAHNMLLKQCAEQKILLEAVLAKLDLLLKGGVGHIQLEETNGDINLPLRTIQDIEKLEESLKHENNKKHLGKILLLVGGSDSHKLIRRCLSRIFVDELAAKCSFTGAKNNFKVGGLLAIEELKKIVNHTFQISEFEFEKVVKDFFRYAGQRMLRNCKNITTS